MKTTLLAIAYFVIFFFTYCTVTSPTHPKKHKPVGIPYGYVDSTNYFCKHPQTVVNVN